MATITQAVLGSKMPFTCSTF